MPDQNSSASKKLEYIKEYNRENIVYKKINFNRGKPDEMQIVEWLESRPEGIAMYLKRLIAEDMKKNEASG